MQEAKNPQAHGAASSPRRKVSPKHFRDASSPSAASDPTSCSSRGGPLNDKSDESIQSKTLLVKDSEASAASLSGVRPQTAGSSSFLPLFLFRLRKHDKQQRTNLKPASVKPSSLSKEPSDKGGSPPADLSVAVAPPESDFLRSEDSRCAAHHTGFSEVCYFQGRPCMVTRVVDA
jgi:hypothetical protein